MTAESSIGMVPPPQERLSLNKLAQREGIHLSTIHRWCQRGVLGRNGTRAWLRTVRIGGRTFVTADSFREFLEATNREHPAAEIEPTIPASRNREALVRSAKRELRERGVQLKGGQA